MLRTLVRGAILLFLAVVLLGVARFMPLFDGWAEVELDREPKTEESVERAPRRVLLVSVDGMATRLLEAVPTPFIDSLKGKAIVAENAETVVPSITMTSHASMLSGQSPEEHGIFFNRFEPWREVVVETLFSSCREAKRICGLFAGKKKFIHFAERETGVERYRFGGSAALVLDAATTWVESRDPDFVFLHLAEVDLTGHTEGWDSQAQRDVLEEIDGLLEAHIGRMREASERPLEVLITADHGGVDKGHHEDRPENRKIPWILSGPSIANHRLTAPVSTRDTAGTIAVLLGMPSPNDSPPVSVPRARRPPSRKSPHGFKPPPMAPH